MTGILLIGVSTIYFFREQQKEKILEFEAYEIENIEEKVDDLYNEEKTDISEEAYDSSDDTGWNSNNSESWNNSENTNNSWAPSNPTVTSPQENESSNTDQGGTNEELEEIEDSISDSEDSTTEDPSDEQNNNIEE